MPLEVMRSFEDKFGCVILEGYGLSETSPVASFNMPDRGAQARHHRRRDPRLRDALRRPRRRGGAAVGEVGEIAIRGDNVMKGYWRNPEATAEAIPDGWFRTGDLATMDDEGYFTIVDRKKDMILRGGMNVYPREVEEVIYTHPDVLEVAVVGVPDDLYGEQVGAAVALREGSTATTDDIIEFTKERIAAYKYPRTLWVVDALPKGPRARSCAARSTPRRSSRADGAAEPVRTLIPPSTGRQTPLTNAARADARKRAALATSQAVPIRPVGLARPAPRRPRRRSRRAAGGPSGCRRARGGPR